MVVKFQNLGFDIAFEEVEKTVKGNMGRPHIAKILLKKYPQEFSSIKDIFDRYLGNGKPAYVERADKTRVKEAIELIKKAGGIPILAHPGIYQKEDALELIKYFSEIGGAGVETYYPYDLINRMTEEEFEELTKSFRKFTKEHGLLESGGSDFHGETRKSVGLNQMKVPDFVLENLRNNIP